jgi:16S rRNA (guanine(966)-N(2))-methyltransferase RsmD
MPKSFASISTPVAPTAQAKSAVRSKTIARTAQAPQEVRIIGGTLRRRKLPVANKPGLRPTPDRVRETLFNWLGQDLSMWHCVDAFAGSGALGFEAASRGAHSVLMFENDPQLVQSLQKSALMFELTSVTILRIDGLLALAQQAPASADLIFLDPPFDSDLLAKALPAAVRMLKAQAWLYVEAGTALSQDMAEGLGLTLYRQLKAGQVVAQLYQKVVAD